MRSHPPSATRLRGKGDGRSYYTYCQNCSDETGHCEVDPIKGVYFCHRCGRGGGMSGTESTRPIRKDPSPPPRYSGPLPFRRAGPGDPLLGYLRGRGMATENIRDLDPHLGPRRTVLYFPVYRKGIPVYWVGRETRPDHPTRYWYPPNGHPDIRPKSEVLWGLDRWVETRDTMGYPRMVLVEGIFDAVRSRDRVALLGKTLTSWQVNEIYGLHPSRVIVALDGDAYTVTHTVVRRLWAGGVKNVRVCQLPEGVDPDTLDKTVGPSWVERYMLR